SGGEDAGGTGEGFGGCVETMWLGVTGGRGRREIAKPPPKPLSACLLRMTLFLICGGAAPVMKKAPPFVPAELLVIVLSWTLAFELRRRSKPPPAPTVELPSIVLLKTWASDASSR